MIYKSRTIITDRDMDFIEIRTSAMRFNHTFTSLYEFTINSNNNRSSTLSINLQ